MDMDDAIVHVLTLSCEKKDRTDKVFIKMIEKILHVNRPILISIFAILLGILAIAIIFIGLFFTQNHLPDIQNYQIILATLVASALLMMLAWGIWTLKDWARTAVMLILILAGLFYGMMIVFQGFGVIFSGEHIMTLKDILRVIIWMLQSVVVTGIVPVILLYGLSKYHSFFVTLPKEREFVDQSVRYILLIFASSAIVIVFLIILFTFNESLESIDKIGLNNMLLGTIWRPGGVIGTTTGQFGLVPMIVGSVLSTFGAVVLGIPISIGVAILLAEIAPVMLREILRPAVELLAGIPSVVYGLFGMVVLAPMIRTIKVPYNSGFNILNASIILAIMIMPTVTSIAEDAIRSVPQIYREGSLGLGATHWQTIWQVILPSARSGIIAAVILGIGRALGETMAIIMVMGNSIAIPTPLTNNPLTLFLSTARSLTGNIAVEINYAAGAHRSALFFTGVILFIMIFAVDSYARYLMREKTFTH